MDLPNNRFKLPFFVVCGGVFVWMLATDAMIWIAAPLLALCLVSIGVIASGRNPRWLRSPLDRREAARRQRNSN